MASKKNTEYIEIKELILGINEKVDKLEKGRKEDRKYLDKKLDENKRERNLAMNKQTDRLEIHQEQSYQKYKSELLNEIDPILKEVVNSRDDRTVQAHQISRNSDRIDKLENKFKNLL